MTILLISSSDIHSAYGGGQVYFRNIVDAFLPKNIRTEIVCPGEENDVEYQGIKIHYFNPNNCEESLKKLLIHLKPNIIHAHGFKGTASKVGNELNIPVVITAHHGGILCPAGALLNHEDKICQVKASHNNCLPCVLKNIRCGIHAFPVIRNIPLQQALSLSNWVKDHTFIPYFSPVFGACGSIQTKFDDWKNIICYSSQMIAPSHAIAEAMIRNGYPENRLKVIPHGIPLPNGLVSCKSVNSKMQLFYLGRINRVKGLHILCEAAHRVSDSFDLHIFGNAVTKDEKRYQKHLKAKFKDEKRIHWLGNVPKDQVFKVISQMDIMIHLAIYVEIYSFYIAETLASGIPVIATSCGGAGKRWKKMNIW
jgi:glycosyltransferase involved in cell wall biosynthesis